jgi:glycosyltransferase involved in cell wall biosynthesis
MTVITPSKWLKRVAKQSFFKNYNIEVINNGIDLRKFKPIESDFRKINNLTNKKIILAVANVWEKRKGLDVLIELANNLSDDYKIVMVGTNDKIDVLLPLNVLSIHRTYDQEELIKIYSAADVFVNPTREDNFPTVNIEALACGTPVITFNTGGSPEIIDDTCGTTVAKNDVKSLLKEIKRVCAEKAYSSQACIERAKNYDMDNVFQQYIQLYKDTF